VPPAPSPKGPPTGHWCQNPNVWPLAWRAVNRPCTGDEIEGCEIVELRQGHEWHSIQACPGADKNACARQAAAFVRPLQQLLGWTRPTLPSRADFQARPKPKPPAPVSPAKPGPTPTPTPAPITYIVPDKYTCLKNGAFNLVDCYTADNFGNPIDLFWSNHVDGPWRGEPAPAHAPAGAGIGYKAT
jgi:hypothetical protein